MSKKPKNLAASLKFLGSAKPYEMPAFDLADVTALQALRAGNATEHQQKRALDWIITSAGAINVQPYQPGGIEGERDTAFALGRQFVAKTIIGILSLDPLALKQLTQDH